MEPLEQQAPEPTASDVFNLAVEPSAILPASPQAKVDLGSRTTAFAEELCDIISSHDTAMRQRILRWQDISDAYNLVADPSRGGPNPQGQRLVSELTRSQVNIATSRIVEGIRGLEPLMHVQVLDDQASDPKTEMLLMTAKALGSFLDNYGQTIKLPDKVSKAIHRACKMGSAIIRPRWEVRDKVYFIKSKGSAKPKEIRRQEGRIVLDLIPNDQMILWPLHKDDVEELDIIGHRDFKGTGKFRTFAKKLKVSNELINLIIASESGDAPEKESTEKNLKGMDMHVSPLSVKGEIKVTELFVQDYYIEDRGKALNLQVFLHEDSKTILGCFINPLYCQKPNYIHFQYWNEDGAFWGSGVGQECLWPQAADSAMWNMFVDNLKVIGNMVIFVRSGSMAETLSDEIAPGQRIPTESPEDDLRLESLGGDLTQITEAIGQNEMRAMKTTGITAPTQGFGDPVMKSGASPSSLAQLIQQSGKRFGQVDRNMRESLADLNYLILELIQQYAPDGMIAQRSSQENADIIKMSRYAIPPGELRSTYRLVATAPSASSNKELMKQHLFMLYNLATQHVQAMMGIGDQVIGATNPVGWNTFKEKMLNWMHNDLFVDIVDIHETPGMKTHLPKVEPPTDTEQIANQLQQQNQQLQQQLMEMTAQFEALMAQAQSQDQSQLAGQMPPTLPPGGGGMQGMIP